MRRLVVRLAAFLALACPPSAAADAIAPAPPGFDAKRPLDPSDLRRKKEDSYVTGLPLANFDPNTGIGGGARAYYYFNGDRDDPFFAYTPYLHRVFVQAFFTTKGLQFHWLDWDAPAFGGTPFRLRSQLIFLRNTQQHFYGLGAETLAPLTFTGAGRSFDSYSDYDDALRALRPDGSTLSRYNDYELIRPIWLLSVERTFARGLIRPLLGLGVTYASIDDYTGETVEADSPGGEVDAIMGTTRLRERCDAGTLVGCAGGWDNTIRLGISFDTRDFEPDPNRGVFLDAALDVGTQLVGSNYDYLRFLLSARAYYSLLPKLTDLVLAGRLTFQAQSREVPFTSAYTIPFTEDARSGPGGHRTLRGFRQDRFLTRHFTLANLELRWTFHHFELLAQRFALGALLFVDTGRVYDRLEDLSFSDWKRGQGGGIRIAWNQATIVAVDYGISDEDTGLYINFNHQF